MISFYILIKANLITHPLLPSGDASSLDPYNALTSPTPRSAYRVTAVNYGRRPSTDSHLIRRKRSEHAKGQQPISGLELETASIFGLTH